MLSLKQIGTICLTIFLSVSLCFASGVSPTATTADCDNETLSTYGGTTNLQANWGPNKINLYWYSDDTLLDVQDSADSCFYDGALTIPDTPPTKTGYTFDGWKVRDLPHGYTKLEYIQTDGNSWIDTNIIPTATTLRIDYKMQLLGKDYVSLFGSVDNPQPRKGFRIFYQPSMSETVFYLQSVSLYSQNITWNEILQGSVVIQNGVSIVSTVNGNTKTMNSSSINLTNSGTILIGTSHLATNGVSGKAPIKIWSFMINKNNAIVFNGIPAKNSSNVVGLYDLVSKTFFTNAGTGSFVAGPVEQ